MAIIRIKNLHVSTYIGFNPEELVNKQEVLINLEIKVGILPETLANDDPEGIYDYKIITKKIMAFVQESRFNLLEVLVQKVLDLIMSDQRVQWAKAEANKPGALRFAESVSVEMETAR